jgi:hypothetical protein
VTNNDAAVHGVLLHWVDADDLTPTMLLDTTPASAHLAQDSPLRLGRSFHDLVAALVITPVASGVEAGAKWFDVAVAVGPPASNQPPSLSLTPSGLAVLPGQTVSFQADAADGDGDELAFFWDFGDGSFAGGTNLVQKSWRSAGDYTVRIEVSDLRGGVTSKHVVVRVGQPQGWRIAGHVLDEMGSPLAGVRVQNGRVLLQPGDHPDYAVTFTDSDGAFTLANQPQGRYEVGAFLPSHTLRPAGLSASVEVRDGDVSGVDFIGQPLPVVSVDVTSPTVEEGGDQAEFVFTRSGPTNDALPVWFALSGTAIHVQDYPSYPERVLTIPAGADSVRLPFTASPDSEEEDSETVTVTAVPPPDFSRLAFDGSETNLAYFNYPGWELRPHENAPLWHLIEPQFTVDSRSSATLTVLNAPPWGVQRVSVWGGFLQLRGQAGRTYVIEASTNLSAWLPISTNTLPSSPDLLPIAVPGAWSRRFYRSYLLSP